MSIPALLVLLAGVALPFAAAAAEAPCGTGFGTALALGPVAGGDAARAWMARPVEHAWGLENARLAEEGGQPLLRVRYPAGSVNPGADGAPRGGLGFFIPVAEAAGAREVCLRYRVRFPAGFDFVRGGKLPGLYGGDAPRGGAQARENGFSARLMWRAGGAGELYLYAPGQSTPYGESLGRGSFAFRPGAWAEVVEHLRPGKEGALRLLVDGRERAAVRRALPAAGGAGLMMSTFFGGQGPAWATPRAQSADFAGFTLWVKR